MLALAVLFVAAEWHYAISVDPTLATITTTVCVSAGAIPALDTNATFADRWQLEKPKLINKSCARSRAALAAAAKKEKDHRRAIAVGRDFVFSPDLFMLVPDGGFSSAGAGTKITASVQLPPNISFLTPWKQSGDKYLVPTTTFDWRISLVLGKFQPEKISAHGATLDVAILDAPMRATRPGIAKWLSESMRATIELYGKPPVERLMVIVDPVPYGRDVQFGAIFRGGGPSALFLLGASATDAALPGEWTAVHELSHLFLPFIDRDHVWLSEGIATYYQNMLRARAGHLTAEEAWQKMIEGFERGLRDQGDDTLAEVSAAMHQNHRYMRVYWSGAAIALFADVELRAASKNERSLDTTLRALRDCCTDDGRMWSLEQITARLDAAGETKVYSTLFQRHLTSTAFPDLSATYRELGLIVESGRVRLDDRAPRAWVRQAITAPKHR